MNFDRISTPLAAALMGAALGGCASSASSIKPAYVSPAGYQSFGCGQLAAEGARISIEASKAAHKQNQKRTHDAVVTAVGVVVFWPTLFLIDGNGPKAAEVARLKGEMKAIEQAAKAKNCNIAFKRV